MGHKTTPKYDMGIILFYMILVAIFIWLFIELVVQ